MFIITVAISIFLIGPSLSSMESVKHENIDPAACWPYYDGLLRLRQACAEGDLSLVRKLLELAIPIDATYGVGQQPYHYPSPLYFASAYGHIDVVNFLITKGADVQTPIPGTHTMTAKEGATNEPIPYGDGCAAIHIAARNGHRQVVEALVTAGAPADTPTNTQMTAAALARVNGHFELASWLEHHNDTAVGK